MKEFSEILHELHKERHVSQKAIAELLGITDRNIRFYESGSHRPDFDGLLLLADSFDVSIDIWLAAP